MEMTEKSWLDRSTAIRLEHECAHYFTLRYFGCMSNNIHDELLADYMGICKVAGVFQADWFLRFMGLEHYPNYHTGRLENYLGNPPISKSAFQVLQAIVYAAAINVAQFDQTLGEVKSSEERIQRLLALCQIGLLSMAAKNGSQLLLNYYNKLKIG